MKKQLYTRWGRDIDAGNVLPEYPRPQFMRKNYTDLNGYWDYAVTSGKNRPEKWNGRILVPFSPESALSGVGRQLQPDETLWMQRRINLKNTLKPELTASGKGPEPELLLRGGHVLLHFGAADQICGVFVNGIKTAEHTGGFTPFSCDITSCLKKEENILTVQIADVSDTSWHARGKQKLKRGGMYYTATSGIWQSVWMETVPEHFIERIVCEPDADENIVRIRAVFEDGFPACTEKLKITLFEPEIYREREFPAADVLCGKMHENRILFEMEGKAGRRCS